MRDYRIVKTTAEVWNAIRASHREQLKVFSSYSAPDGDYFGNSSQGKMFTAYGFDQGDYPIMQAETTWDIDRQNLCNRINEVHEYWLCLPIKEVDD